MEDVGGETDAHVKILDGTFDGNNQKIYNANTFKPLLKPLAKREGWLIWIMMLLQLLTVNPKEMKILIWGF